MKRRNQLFILVILTLSIIVICTFSVRNSAIKEHDWKITGGADLGNDFICFTEDSSYSYNYPLIKRQDKTIAVALFQLEGKLIVFSTETFSISFLMYI